MSEADAVRGKELMCDHCGCTRWKCLTKFEGECCHFCQHPAPTIGARPPHPLTQIGRVNP